MFHKWKIETLSHPVYGMVYSCSWRILENGLLVKFLMYTYNSSHSIVEKASCFHSWIVQKSYGHVDGSLWKWVWQTCRKKMQKRASTALLNSNLWCLNAHCSKLTRVAYLKPKLFRIYMFIAIQWGMSPAVRAPITFSDMYRHRELQADNW